MTHGNVLELLRAGYTDRLTDPALTVPGGDQWTYGRLDDLGAHLARALLDRNLAKGDRVLTFLPKSTAAVALYLATLRIGAIHVPLNPAYTEREKRFFVEDAQPALVVGAQVDGRAVPLETIISEATTAEPHAEIVPCSGDDVAALIYTSGTTGRPKGAMLTHANLAVNALAIHEAWGWRDDDVLLHALPIFHVHGLFVAMHCAMLSGSEVLFLPRFDPAAVRRALPSATVMMGVPTFYHRLLADPGFGAGDCRTMRLFVAGSAPLSERSHREFAARTGHAILERYGMSEAGMICTNPLDGTRLPGTVGYPFAGYEARVAGDDDMELPPDHVGMLQIRGPSLFAGYWGQPEATAACFTADGFFRTGDMASAAADGRITLHGRASDLIITGGYNVYPKEIESVLDEVAGVGESAVVGVPDPDLGETVVAFVVRDGHVSEEALRSAVEAGVARYKQPRRYVFLDTLPRNAMGKVEKARLRTGA